MPIQKKDAARPAPRQRELDFLKENEDVDCLKETDYCRPEDIIEVIETMEGLSEISRAKRPEATDESYRMAAANCISSSVCRREREKRRLAEILTRGQLDLTEADSEEDEYDRRVEAQYSQEASDVLSSTISHEALLGRHNAYNRSPLDVLSRLILKSQKYEQPRPAPAAPSAPISPRKGALDFIMRRSSTSTRGHSRSGSIKMNFRKLSIDVQPTRSVETTNVDSDSPDWAYQTSRAIERSEILMDSVSKQGQELMRSKHVTQDVRNPTDRRNTYPSPTGKRSPVSPRHARHSESAPQALRASASRRHGRLVGMEIASPRRETARHGNAQDALVVDLNKRLPALPPHTGSDDGEDRIEYI
ncbi:hypothetical protein E8E11_005386 [Didymella keratinophila]|nr:hypothetical protein E8E11_005386 [Didymella keratinophila]